MELIGNTDSVDAGTSPVDAGTSPDYLKIDTPALTDEQKTRLKANGFDVVSDTNGYVIKNAGGEIQVPSNLINYFGMTPTEIQALPFDEAQGVAYNLQALGSSGGQGPADELFATFSSQSPAATADAVASMNAMSSGSNSIGGQLESTVGNLSNPMAIIPNAISRYTGGSGNFAKDLGANDQISGVLAGTDYGDTLKRIGITGLAAGAVGAGVAGAADATLIDNTAIDELASAGVGDAGAAADVGLAGAVGAGVAGAAAKFDLTDPSTWDWGKIAGGIIPAGIGYEGAKYQADAQTALADKYMAMGEPSRTRYENSFAPDFTMANDPGYMDAINQASKATLHGLSSQGNPADSPNAWAQSLSDLYSKSAYPALQNYRTLNSASGGLANSLQYGAQAGQNAISAGGGQYDAAAYGANQLNNIFNPPKRYDIYGQPVN